MNGVGIKFWMPVCIEVVNNTLKLTKMHLRFLL